MDLTNEDVADILALLDSLPYDSLDLETSRFRLTLRRGPGGWTEESQVLADPTTLTLAPDAGSTTRPADAAGPGGAHAGTAAEAGTYRATWTVASANSGISNGTSPLRLITTASGCLARPSAVRISDRRGSRIGGP